MDHGQWRFNFMKVGKVEIKNKNTGMGTGTGTGPGASVRKRRRKEADYYRVSINKQAADSLDLMIAKANDGFEGGQITKSDIANRIVIEAAKAFSEADVKALRSIHFDERRMLQALLSASVKAEDLPEDIKGALRKHYGISDSDRRRSARTIKDGSSDLGSAG